MGAVRDADEIVEHLFALAERVRQRFDEVVATFDLSPAQAKALRSLASAGPVPMRDLACRLRCDASNVTGIVDRLEQRGLIERRPEPGDRRVKVLVVTTSGNEVATAAWAAVRDGLALDGIPPADRAMLIALLRRLD